MPINAATVSSLWQKLDTLTLTDDESAVLHRAFDAPMFVKRPVERVRARFGGGLWAVSYTHLTLPTSDLV